MASTIQRPQLILTASMALVIGLLLRPVLTPPPVHAQPLSPSQAATAEIGAGPGRYQLVTGSDRETFLFDTRTGRVWLWAPTGTQPGGLPDFGWKEMPTPVTQIK